MARASYKVFQKKKETFDIHSCCQLDLLTGRLCALVLAGLFAPQAWFLALMAWSMCQDVVPTLGQVIGAPVEATRVVQGWLFAR